MRLSALALIVVICLAGRSGAQILLVNEIGTGTADYVEVMNVSAATVAIGGYQIWFGNEVLNPNTFGYGVPAGATIATNRALIFRDAVAPLPPYQAGTAAYALPANTIKWQPGNPGSVSVLDATGAGLDYLAFGNPNGFIALFANGAGAPTLWNGDGAPTWGLESGLNTLDTFVRNTRGDTDTGADWNMTTAANWTPSYLNAFQNFTDADTLPPTASFTTDVSTGASPLTVRFSNTSFGDCQLGTVTWDFDFTANPGVLTSANFNEAFTFTNPPLTPQGSTVNYDVQLTIVDSCGGIAISPITTIGVVEPFQAIPQAYAYIEDFEGPTDPNTGNAMSFINGWDIRKSNATNARVRTIDPRTDGAPLNYTDATLAQPTVAVLDSAGPGLTTTQEVVLHLDADTMFLLSANNGFRVVLWASHSGEIASSNDLIFFQDGVTTGDAVDAQGNILTGTPGLDTFKEVLLSDVITQIGPAHTWTRLEFAFDLNFFATNGLATPTGSVPDARFVIRHESSGTYASGEGLLIDRVQLLPPSVSSAGSPGIPGLAVMDVSHAVNVNDHFVGYVGDENGPHFSTLAGQATMDIDIAGESNQPILLLSGPLNVLAADYTGLDPLIGQFDIGGPVDMTGIPTQFVVLADGTGTQLPPTLFNLIWNTGADGVFSLSAALPPGIPSGFQIPMQAVVFRTGGVSISNAVVLTIL